MGDSSSRIDGGIMSNHFWLTEEQMERLRPYYPKSHGKPRVDDLRVLSGIIFINRNGLRWCDAPREYGPPKTLYNRWRWWGDMGVFARMMEGLAFRRRRRADRHDRRGLPESASLPGSTCRACARGARPRACGRKRGGRRPARASDWAHEGWLQYQAACRHRRQGRFATTPELPPCWAVYRRRNGCWQTGCWQTGATMQIGSEML